MSVEMTSPQASEREYVLSDRDFERVRALIYARAGIALGAQKREMAYSRLVRRLRNFPGVDFKTYLDLLENDANSPEWEDFTNALTTNLTAFFREPHHFPLLAKFVTQRQDPVEVWSCAASTGEEPYSIAMTLTEALGSRASQARVLGTDIDTKVIQQAQRGVYAMQRVEGMSQERLKRFFLKGKGEQAGYVKVKPELARMLEYRPLNLLDRDWGMQGRKFDVIFCRNIMIYFDKKTQAEILKRFVPLMKPGGLLFAGHSENFTYITNDFVLRGQTMYELTGGRP
ncbi:CheR family methyltransferase [Corticimicrobacter populi]|uniref:Chemotaxis protein methyltransferase n=1 Tax=Corticimicrobacter populi TaxID=2175229 RepID=A0A2V1JY25_9BURK|nr:CheR family methyltransferase [Corticimicrobacter populi]PWF21207.1 chemotaxis protein CheR [Corticimicrobacter populi]